jgi:hypothetical protein
MTMLTTFAPPARQTVIRAGLLASEGGATRLGDGYLLLALAESQPLTSPVDLGVTAAMVRASRRGHRTQIAREDLLWGLLADASSESVRILRRCQVDLGRLWADLRRWHQSA